MTNGEKLRAMTDKEMAIELCQLFEDCADCPFEGWCYGYDGNGALEWLKQEVDK